MTRVVHRYKNGSDRPVILFLEPWAQDFELKPGAKTEFSVEPNDEKPDSSYFELTPECVMFWCEGSMCDVSIDGKEVY